MFFSVVVPSHKRKTLLDALLKSLEQQSFKEFEVIVVPTEKDPAFELKDKNWNFPLRMEFIPNDPTKGKSASAKRNYGAQIASAPWIAFIDDDCVASPQWLQEAHQAVIENQVDFLEGSVHIPEPEKKTFTYKGIQRLSRPGGFQTCNMFYKKQDFLDLGGFDKNFPYYLEDTDLAWSFMDAGKESVFAEKAQVSHPVPEPAPHKMLESAWRMEKLPYLYKKHPETFKNSHFRVLPRAYVIFILIDLAMAASLFFNPALGSLLLLLRLATTMAVLMRMYRNCSFTWVEVTAVYYFLLICPIISLYSLMKGNLKQGVFLLIR